MARKEKNDQIFSIGAAAKEVGVSAHVLRKWQSRYDVVQPLRGKNGRRMYSREQVDRLRLIKNLMDSGVELKALATKTTEELSNLDQLKLDSGLVRVFGSPFIEGNRRPQGMHVSLVHESMAWDGWKGSGADPADLLVVEIPNVDNQTVQRLLALGALSGAPLLIIYRYAHPSLVTMLRAAGIKVHRGPVSVWLIEDLLFTGRSSAGQPEPHLAPVSPRAFTEKMVMAVGNAADVVKCECPKNIANILSDLYAFENYSLECVATQPDDAEIHQYLHQVTANARFLFEQALARLAEYEGIEIK